MVIIHLIALADVWVWESTFLFCQGSRNENSRDEKQRDSFHKAKRTVSMPVPKSSIHLASAPEDSRFVNVGSVLFREAISGAAWL
jgi:hypothetical protein